MNAEILAHIVGNPDSLERLPDDELAELLAALEGLKARIWLRLLRSPVEPADEPPEPETDRLLTVEEMAELLGVTTRYVYDHADDWPFKRKLSPRKLRFSERGLYRWLERRG